MDPASPSSAPRTVTRSGVLTVPDGAFLGCSPPMSKAVRICPKAAPDRRGKSGPVRLYALRSTLVTSRRPGAALSGW
jgi:hypothetical protein